MARRPVLPEMSPWKWRPLTIPPDSLSAWMGLAVWEFWMGVIVCGALVFGTQLIITAPRSIVTVSDSHGAYRTGALNMMFSAWCGLLLIAVAAWLLWELWNAVAPKPITDDFLQLLDDSFGRDWRRPRTWPWARVVWAYGFTLVGGVVALCIGLVGSTVIVPSAKAPAARVETSQRFRHVPTTSVSDRQAQ